MEITILFREKYIDFLSEEIIFIEILQTVLQNVQNKFDYAYLYICSRETITK